MTNHLLPTVSIDRDELEALMRDRERLRWLARNSNAARKAWDGRQNLIVWAPDEPGDLERRIDAEMARSR